MKFLLTPIHCIRISDIKTIQLNAVANKDWADSVARQKEPDPRIEIKTETTVYYIRESDYPHEVMSLQKIYNSLCKQINQEEA